MLIFSEPMNYVLERTPPTLLDDDDFDEWMEGENSRLDELFCEAQRMVRAHPQWLQNLESDFDLSPSTAAILRHAATVDSFPVMWRGQVIRTERVPDPSISDLLVRIAAERIEENNYQLNFKRWNDDMLLTAEGLRNLITRNLSSFRDFDRDARTGIPNSGNPDNVRVYLKMHNLSIRWNAWWQRQEIAKDDSGIWEAITDTIVAQLMTEAGDSQHQFRPAEILFRRTLETIAHETIYDPVLEYLDAAEQNWDGTPRLATWLSAACGVPCDPYHQAVGKNVIGGMVKRAREPGAKHDEVMILIGAQGTFKSSLCKALPGQSEYFTDSVAFDGSPQNTIPQLFGKWVVELSEMDGMANREVSFLKAFISRQSDNVTLKYRAIAEDHARRCIFIGTSNDDRILRDATGNRRFLPVRISQTIDVDWVRENLDLLLGEAAALHSAGANFTIPTEVLPAAQAHQEAARVEADFEVFLDEWFGGDQPCLVKATDVATALRETCGRSVPANKYGPAMKRLGFVDGTVRLSGKPTWCWKRGQADQRNAVTLHRDQNGRLLPVQRPGFTPVVVPSTPLPGQATAS